MRLRCVVQNGLLATFSIFTCNAAFATVDGYLLGRGFSPFLNTVEEAVVAPDAKPSPMQGAGSQIGFGLVANSFYLERVISADASVAFAGSGWGGKTQAEFRKRFEENRRQVSFAATVQVIRGTRTLSPIKIADGARALLSSDPARYFRTYGTTVIDSVSFGGAAVFLFTFNFNSIEEAMKFSLSAEGYYGAIEGDLKVSIRELLKKSSNKVSVSGFVTGTNELPEFFGASLAKDGSDRATFFSEEYSTQMLDQLVAYVDGFDDKIEKAPDPQLSQVDFSVRSITQIASAGGLTKQAEKIYKETVQLGNQLNEDETSLNERRNDLLLMTSAYRSYNTEANLKRADEILKTLDSAVKKLKERRALLQTTSDLTSPAIFPEASMSFPQTFCTKRPTDISPNVFARHNTRKKFEEYVVTPTDPNATYTVRADVWYAHSETEPGCINGVLEVRQRSIAVPAENGAQELASAWTPRPDTTLRTGESVVRSLPHFAVCRDQPPKTFSTVEYPFVAADRG